MKDKKVIVLAVVIVALILGFIFIIKPALSRKVPAKLVTPAAARPGTVAAKVPAKKAISKDMGGLTVKVSDSKGRDLRTGGRIFKSVDQRSSVYAASFTTNIMQELLPGEYDVEVNTTPAKIYKGLKISKGVETVEMAASTGSIKVAALNSKNQPANIAVRMTYPKSNAAIATSNANRSTELLPGEYDIVIETLPKEVRKGVKVESGKEVIIDLGSAAGELSVKVMDANKKEARRSVAVKNSGTGETVTSLFSGRPIDLLSGVYIVELASTPKQVRKDVRIEPGKTTVLEFEVEAPVVRKVAPKK